MTNNRRDAETPDETDETANSSVMAAVSFRAAFLFWLKLGFVSFGGPAGQIALMQRELVERRRWTSQEDFLHALNFCLLLPGPEAQQLAAYNGWRLHGWRGGVVAGAFFVLPSVFILLGLSYIYAVYGSLPIVAGIFDALKAVVLAIVIEAVWKIGNRALLVKLHFAIALAAFVAVQFLGVPFPLVIAVAALISILIGAKSNGHISNLKSQVSDENVRRTKNISKYYLPKTVLVFLVLWVVPFLTAAIVFGINALPTRLYLFFTQTAFVTFGGAYAILAYVNQVAVESFGWLTAAEAVDGLALAETTPGPLIMLLQFVGFMAGWNNVPAGTNQIVYSIVCALLTTYATFLPSFLFVLAGAPYIERLRHNRLFSTALSGITAAVVGVIFTLALSFGATVIFPNGLGNAVNLFAVALSLAALVALLRFHVSVLWLIAGGALLGLTRALLF